MPAGARTFCEPGFPGQQAVIDPLPRETGGVQLRLAEHRGKQRCQFAAHTGSQATRDPHIQTSAQRIAESGAAEQTINPVLQEGLSINR